MKHKILFLFFSILLSGGLYAQKETNWWFFGMGNSLNFNETTTVNDSQGVATYGMPKAAGTGKINTLEGCFTLSDSDGNLMMYSNGITIWDKNGAAMPNGTGLLGGDSSTQSGIVVPYPGSPGKYYAISVAEERGANGITYSVVDMSLRDGLGNVVEGQKNKSLLSEQLTDENIAAVRKTNSNNYWIIHRRTDLSSNICTFYVWELTPGGFSSTPATFTIVMPSFLDDTGLQQGYLKFSSDGTRFASPTDLYPFALMFSGEFDPATGQISNLQCRSLGFPFLYSCEFSLSGDHLFITSEQYGLIYISWNNLRKTIINAVKLDKPITNVQMNSDGRIYGTEWGLADLYVIMNPESGANADIRTFTNYLSVNARLGLPTFSASWWAVADIEADPALPACKETEITFNANIKTAGNSNVKRIGWSFGDGSAEVFDTDMTQATFTQKHSYRNPGVYTLTVTPYNAAGDAMTDMVKTQEVTILSCSVPVNPHARGYIVK